MMGQSTGAVVYREKMEWIAGVSVIAWKLLVCGLVFLVGSSIP